MRPTLASRPAWVWVLLLGLAYGAAHLVWYWGTPLGSHPVLDERENLDLAARIAAGALPPEPFYRAMLYPLALALFPALGMPAAAQPFAATALGLALHFINGVLVALLARALFRGDRAALVAAALHAFNPVLIHEATQILDGALANTFLLAGLLALLAEPRPSPRPRRRAALAALAWSLAALTRPQTLPLLPLLPVAWWLLHGRPRPATLAALAAAALAPWLVLGATQYAVCGQFRLLPTQGPYNLWAANRPGADGRYFAQSVLVPPSAAHENPARYETLALYARETGAPPDQVTLDDANRHWRARLAETLRADPVAWLRLLGRKAVHLLSDHEPYNNKTFAFHRDRSPWLRFNPICWALLLAAAAPGLVALWHRDRAAALALLLVLAALAASLLLTFVSGRFRVAIAAPLCAAAGGLAALGPVPLRARLAALAAGLGLGALSLSNPLRADDRRTFDQDRLLVASAARRAGEDRIAWDESSLVLARSPGHPVALGFHFQAGFHLLLASSLTPEEETRWRYSALRLLAREDTPSPVRTAAALALWRGGSRPEAMAIWTALRATDPEAEAALALAGAIPAPTAPPAQTGVFGALLEARLNPAPDARRLELLAVSDRLFSPATPR